MDAVFSPTRIENSIRFMLTTGIRGVLMLKQEDIAPDGQQPAEMAAGGEHQLDQRVDPGFEPVKVDQILEVLNHLGTMDFVIRTTLEPLTSDYVKKLHYLLTYGTYADRKQYFGSGTFRTQMPRLYKDTATAHKEIDWKLINYGNSPSGPGTLPEADGNLPSDRILLPSESQAAIRNDKLRT